MSDPMRIVREIKARIERKIYEEQWRRNMMRAHDPYYEGLTWTAPSEYIEAMTIDDLQFLDSQWSIVERW